MILKRHSYCVKMIWYEAPGPPSAAPEAHASVTSYSQIPSIITGSLRNWKPNDNYQKLLLKNKRNAMQCSPHQRLQNGSDAPKSCTKSCTGHAWRGARRDGGGPCHFGHLVPDILATPNTACQTPIPPCRGYELPRPYVPYRMHRIWSLQGHGLHVQMFMVCSSNAMCTM